MAQEDVYQLLDINGLFLRSLLRLIRVFVLHNTMNYVILVDSYLLLGVLNKAYMVAASEMTDNNVE